MTLHDLHAAELAAQTQEEEARARGIRPGPSPAHRCPECRQRRANERRSTCRSCGAIFDNHTEVLGVREQFSATAVLVEDLEAPEDDEEGD